MQCFAPLLNQTMSKVTDTFMVYKKKEMFKLVTVTVFFPHFLFCTWASGVKILINSVRIALDKL